MNKSLFKRPGTKHFQLVHRSQRDPLINDPEASGHVLKEVDSSQAKSRASPSSSTPSPFEQDEATVGDAAAYGIYFDDKDYNYMQHLRPVGAEQNSYLVEAPTKKGKGKAFKHDDFEIRDAVQLPEDSLPSHPLDEISYTDITTGKAPTLGLQPDLDPSIREVLEALDDEAYAVDDGEGTDGEDDFWKDVVHGGEVEEGEEGDWGEEEGDEEVDSDVEGLDDGLEARMARFKKSKAGQAANSDDEDDDDDDEKMSEGGDTIAELRASNARRPPRKAASQSGSQFSMTSSAMFRNEGLRTLDDRFDQIEKMYEEEDSDSSWGQESGDEDEDDDRPAKVFAPARADLDQIMDEFLSRYEVLGGKMRPVLEPTAGEEGGAGKLDRIRRELASLDIGEEEEGEDPEKTARRKEKERILEAVDRQEREATGKKDRIRIDWEKPKERWDCETVLSTYSNVSNHPRLLRARGEGPRPVRILIDGKTGFPMVEGEEEKKKAAAREAEDAEMGSDDESGEEVRNTLIRPRGETPEERKERKAGIKLERSSRRAVKKSTKEAFGNETKRQKRIAGKAVAGGGAADIRVGDGVRRLA